jgi:POT family proton-dependent oligopeptide transporter
VIAKLGVLFLFVAMFWALYEQNGGAWVLQAEKLDRHLLSWFQPVENRLVAAGVTFVAGLSQYEIKSAQVQAINPLLIMFLIPLFSYVVYPAVNRVVKVTPLRKVGAGLALTVFAFGVSGYTETLIGSGGAPPTVWWQLLAFVIITVAEVMVSITCLEFAYTQAPKRMKSLIMGIYLLSETVGNLFTAIVNLFMRFIQNADGSSKLAGANYYWFFTLLMLGTTVIFSVYASFYREKTYIQDDLGMQT